jgi:hypothetical protein
LIEYPSEFHGEIEYAKGSFEEATIANFTKNFLRVIEASIAEPLRSLDGIVSDLS